MNHITSQNPESTMMGQPTTIVAVYPTHTAAEAAVHELRQSGFDLRKLSIIGRDYHTEEHVLGYYNVGDRMKAWGKTGAFWGALWGLLFGSAYFWIPGLGPLLVAVLFSPISRRPAAPCVRDEDEAVEFKLTSADFTSTRPLALPL